MPSKLDQLKAPVKVFHRSSARIAKAPANLFLDDKIQKINIKFEGGMPQEAINIVDIDFLKIKDFNDTATKQPIFILSVNLKDGSHSSFQFESRQIRDEWDHGLRSLHAGAGAQGGNAEVKVPQSTYLPIKSIALQRPDPGQLVSIKLELGKEDGDVKRECSLVIVEGKTDSDACKELAVQFVEDNSILPTEQKSLYRYIRSVVQRAQMEKEVALIVEEVNSQSFERLAAEQGSGDPQQIVALAKARLTTIYNQIPLRVGQHGSGASIATQVLKRNVEKMKIINDLAAQLAAAGK